MLRFAIVCRPSVAFARYEQSDFARQNDAELRKLRSACAFLNPARYRGISRDPIQAMPSSEAVRRHLEERGEDLKTNARALWKLLEVGVSGGDDDVEGPTFLKTQVDAETVFALLDTPEDYEIVSLSNEPGEIATQLLGYDVGYWGGDFFSIICDAVVAPTWHPPDPDDFGEVADHLRTLNSDVLFSRYDDAVAFRSYYTSKAWAETEFTPGEFCVIGVGAV